MAKVTPTSIEEAVQIQVQEFLASGSFASLNDDEKKLLASDMTDDLTTQLIEGDFKSKMNKFVPDGVFKVAIKISLPGKTIEDSYDRITSLHNQGTKPAATKPVTTTPTAKKPVTVTRATPPPTNQAPAATKPQITPTPPTTASNDQDLQTAIMDAQAVLTLFGHYTADIDGAYGPATEAAVKAFAKDNDINHDINIDDYLPASGELKNLKGLMQEIIEPLQYVENHNPIKIALTDVFKNTLVQPNQNMDIAAQRVLNLDVLYAFIGTPPTTPLDVDGDMGSLSRAQFKNAFGEDAPKATPLPKATKPTPTANPAPATTTSPTPQTLTTAEQLQSLVQKSLPSLDSDGTVKFIAESLQADLEASGIAQGIGLDTLVNALHTGNTNGIDSQILDQANKMLNAYQLAPIEPVKPQATYGAFQTKYTGAKSAPTASQNANIDSDLVEAMKDKVGKYYSRHGRVPERVRIDGVRYRVPQGYTTSKDRDGDFEISWKNGGAFRNDLQEQDTVILALPDGQTTIMGRRDLYATIDKVDNKKYWRKEFPEASKGEIKNLVGMADDLKAMVRRGEKRNLANIFAPEMTGSSQLVNHKLAQAIIIPVELSDRILREGAGAIQPVNQESMAPETFDPSNLY